MIEHLLGHPFRTLLATAQVGFIYHLSSTHLINFPPFEGGSMLPTFLVMGDWGIVDATARHGRKIKVGDVVVFKIPISDNIGIKRLVGMPGDYVSVNTPGQKGSEQMIQVPEGHCWVVGDNLPASRDSRYFGPLPLALVEGRVIARILPWNQRQWYKSSLEPLGSED